MSILSYLLYKSLDRWLRSPIEYNIKIGLSDRDIFKQTRNSFSTIQVTARDREQNPEPGSDSLPGMEHFGKTREEQIKINQQGLDLLKKWREEELTDEDLKAATKTWEDVKEIIDRDRDRDRRIFS